MFKCVLRELGKPFKARVKVGPHFLDDIQSVENRFFLALLCQVGHVEAKLQLRSRGTGD